MNLRIFPFSANISREIDPVQKMISFQTSEVLTADSDRSWKEETDWEPQMNMT
jgi:hypothetical protein